MTYVSMWIVSFLFSINKKNSSRKAVLLTCVVILFYFIIAARGVGVDRDYAQYLDYIDLINNGGSIGSTRGGWLFDGISYVASVIHSPLVIFYLYAMSIFIKARLFFKLKEITYCSFLIYVGFFLFLHEFTQIRVGLAIGVAYFSLYYKFFGKSFLRWFGCIVFSCLIHPSLLIIPVFLLVQKFLSRNVLLLLLFASILFCFFDLSSDVVRYCINILNIPDLNIYLQLSIDEQQNKVNFFGLFPLLNLFLSVCALTFIRENKASNFLMCLIKMLACAQIVWFVFYPLPAVAARLSQILLFSIVLVLPYLSFEIFGDKRVLPVVYSFIGFVAYMYVGGLMGGYSTYLEGLL